MEERDLLNNPPAKVLLMYEAVREMVKEGTDINGMKVSDITARAGIGKGTAYEYFASKEELITRALVFDVEKKLQEAEKLVEGSGSFAEKFHGILAFVEENMNRKETFCTLVRIVTGSFEVSEMMKQEYESQQGSLRCDRVERMADRLMEQGVKEGVICQPDVFLRRMAYVAQILSFVTALAAENCNRAADGEPSRQEPGGCKLPSSESLKEFVYASLVKSLN